MIKKVMRNIRKIITIIKKIRQWFIIKEFNINTEDCERHKDDKEFFLKNLKSEK